MEGFMIIIAMLALKGNRALTNFANFIESSMKWAENS